MIQIMEIHALKNDLQKGLTFRNAAEKYILAATNGDKKNKHYIKFLQASGHMFFKSQDSKDISKAYDFYDEANKLLEEIVGNKSIDYLLSFVDIGEVYLYQRDYEKADAFLTFCRDEIIKYYGERSIYLNRVNSALIEVHSETKENRGDITFKYSMDNLDIATELYGEMSIFTLGFYMSGVSANSTRGNYNVVNNILNKMGQILEMSGEGYNGNQYFFLSSIIAGMIASQGKDFEKAVMLFSSTLRRQLEYVGLERDHPFLEQTYYHLAMLYNRAGNLNRSLVMWNSALEVGKRKYGENSYLLATNYKNIGVCEIGLGLINESIKHLDKAKNLCKSKLDTTENKMEIKVEQRELGEIYYNLYLAYVSKSDWDNAISANEQSCQYNTLALGEDDYNVSNSHYLGAQIYLKKLHLDEALHYAIKANDIIDRKPEREPLLFVRYRFLRAKLYKNLEKNKESLKDLDEAIQVSESYKRLYAEEIDLKKFRTDLISTLSEEERASFGIDMEKEQEKERRDKEKRDFLESEYKKTLKRQELNAQGGAPEEGNPEEEDDEEDDSTLMTVAALLGVAAIGAGIFYVLGKK